MCSSSYNNEAYVICKHISIGTNHLVQIIVSDRKQFDMRLAFLSLPGSNSIAAHFVNNPESSSAYLISVFIQLRE